MRINRAELFFYRLPLRRPLPVKGCTMMEREGLLVKLTLDSGGVGWGEIAPLPGWSRERLQEAEDQTRAVLGQWHGKNLPAATRASLEQLGVDLYPSVRFGLEMALCHAAAAETGQPTYCALGDVCHSVVYIQALLDGGREEMLHAASQAVAVGHKAVKLKVGRETVEEDIDRIHQVQEIVGEDICIRLDANRSWTWDQAMTFAKAVHALNIDYMEEPLADEHRLPEWAREGVLPLALDETLIDMRVEDLNRIRPVKAVILKPAVLGGITASLMWAEKALALGITPVISSVFESGIGMRALIQLAALVDKEDTPMGLDTYRWLQKDIVRPPLDISRGVVHAEDVQAGPYEVDMDILA